MTETPSEEIVTRELDTATEAPAAEVAESVAEIEAADPTDLPPMYDCVDGMLDDLFSDPPDPEAQLRVEFSYGTYRITIEQDGTARFVKTE